ncbi:MAG: hypothetical protein IPM29_19910 [Planctomycetes bacterium]|nr:hypothetical protein [Planctomycetota bacterium]
MPITLPLSYRDYERSLRAGELSLEDVACARVVPHRDTWWQLLIRSFGIGGAPAALAR